MQSDAIIFRKALFDLLDNETEIKRLAASELGKIGNRYAGVALKEALEYGDSQLQAEIINSLVRLEDKDTFAICRNFIKHDYAPIRTACIRGLYKAGRNDSVPLLIESLKDENVEVRNSSAMFLGWCEAPTAVPALLQAASDQDRRVRKSAILSLSNIRDEASVLPLIRLLNDSDEDIRKTVTNAIERITGLTVPANAGVEELKEWWITRLHATPKAANAAATAVAVGVAGLSSVAETERRAEVSAKTVSASEAGSSESLAAENAQTAGGGAVKANIRKRNRAGGAGADSKEGEVE